MAGKLIQSALEAAVTKLPDDFATKAESVPNLLKKRGVKDEEVQFSKIGLQLPSTGKVTKDELEQAVVGRADQFDVVEPSLTQYNWVSLPRGADNPTYKERVYTFADKYGEQTRYTAEAHFPDVPNYLMHTRVYDDDIAGITTRVVQEVQSDLHQAGRKLGYDGTVEIAKADRDLIASVDWSDLDNPQVQEALKVLERYGFDSEGAFPDQFAHELLQITVDHTSRQQAVDELKRLFSLGEAGHPQLIAKAESLGFDEVLHGTIEEWIAKDAPGLLTPVARQHAMDDLSALLQRYDEDDGEVIEAAEALGWYEELGDITTWLEDLPAPSSVEVRPPKSPYEESWLRKGLEREIIDAHESGLDQVAVPISGALTPLQRADGVQKWYETTVTSTLKKLAKTQGLEFELKTIPGHGAVKLTGDVSGIAEDIATDLDNAARSEVAGHIIDMLPDFTQAELPSEARIVLMNIANGHTEWDYATRAQFLKAMQPVAEGDVTYAVLKFNGKAPKGFSLYTSPAAATMTAYLALRDGYGEDDVKAQLLADGYDEDEAAYILQDASKASQAKADGYTDEEIQEFLSAQEVTVEQPVAKPLTEPRPIDMDNSRASAYASLIGAEELSIKEIVGKLEVAYPDTTYLATSVASFFGNEEAARIATEAATRSRQRIVNEAHEMGLDLEWDEAEGEWFAYTDDGKFLVTPEWYKSFWEAKGEITGAVTGGILGFKYGTRAGTIIAPEFPVVSQVVGGGIGSIIGAIGGAVAGSQFDYLHSALVLQKDWEANIAAQKVFNAAEASVVGDIIGLGLIKAGGASYRSLRKSLDWLKKGDKYGAIRGLQETLFVTKEEATEIAERLSRVVDTVPGESESDRLIAAVTTTQPGSEGVVATSAKLDPTASRAISKAIADRANDVLESTKSLRGDDIGRWVREDLEGYKTLVKENFERVKVQAAASPGATKFAFNYDKLALEPVLERLGKNIENPDLAFKFAKQAQKIRDMSASRSLPDLLELRKLVNEFKFNKRISNSKDYDMLNGILSRIDSTIELGAKVTLKNPDDWLTAWKATNTEYAQMKGLEKNQLAKVLTRPGVTDKVIADAVTKYAGSLDGTFVDVLAKLPKKTRAKVEGTVINTLAERYTAGLKGGERAVNFPMLADQLREVTFTSPEARSMKKALVELSEVFRNDIPLAQATGNIQIPQFQSYLTADPVVRAKFELASTIFNKVKTALPTKEARALNLVKTTARVLEEPMHSKTIKELMELADDEVTVSQALDKLVKEATLKQAKEGSTTMPRLRMYGDGKVLTGKGSGSERLVPLHRIASTETIAQVAEATGINRADKKALDLALRERGYLAVQLGADKVRLIHE